jgi:hypothetical protein
MSDQLDETFAQRKEQHDAEKRRQEAAKHPQNRIQPQQHFVIHAETGYYETKMQGGS